MTSPSNQLTFDSSSGTLYGSNEGDNSNQTQVIYELNRDLLLRRLETSSLILNELLSVLEEPKNYQLHDPSIYNLKVDINFDTLVNNDLIKLCSLDFKTSSKSQIITKNADEKYESWSLQSDSLKNFKDLEIADDTLTKSFISKLNDLGQHLDNLIKRVINPNSKILVCGDLNSGKSSFVNKLLGLSNEQGKSVMSPVDQLPLTNVFIEFRHVSFNDKNKRSEIHAVKKSDFNEYQIINVMETYNSFETDTYDIFELEELETLINDEEIKNKYGLLVVYVEENEKMIKSHSILKNGVVDCSVIDSPGLNVDDFITNDIFTKQETIDLIIFVVNAENQLTLSGKDFIKAAKAEKSFIFFIVNKFDQIKNKDKCSKLIMDQIAELTPLTYKQHSEFVHCISSKPDDDDNKNDNNDTNDDKKDPDFDKLREAIKNFVVLKKSKNKLEPAQTFLNNFLRDLYFLTDFNIKIYNSRIQIVSDMLTKIRPEIEKMSSSNMDINKKIDYLIDKVVDSGYDFVREGITKCLDDVEIPEYKGITSVHEYILENIEYMKSKIDLSVIIGENHAREITKDAVSKIYDYSSVPEENRLVFDPKVMFSTKSDYSHNNNYHFTDGIEVFFQFQDLFEPSWDGFVKFLVDGNTMLDSNKEDDAVATTSYGIIGNIITQINKLAINPSLIFNSRIPTLALYSLGGSKIVSNVFYYGSSFLSWNSIANLATTIAATGGCLVGAYLISDLPRALPYNLIKKYKEALKERDYPHTEAVRITKDIRKVLKIPQMELITKNNSKLFDIKEKEITWQSILKQLNSNLKFLSTYQDEVVQEQQRLMEIVLEVE